MKRTVMCIVQSESHADLLVQKLLSAGFSSGNVSVLLPARDAANDPTLQSDARSQEVGGKGANPEEIRARTLCLVAPIEELTLSQIGPLIAAGPLLAALNGTEGKTSIDRLTVALINLGILETEARLYAEKVQAGRLLVAVDTHAGDEPRRAAAIFMAARALDLRLTSEVVVPRTKTASVSIHLDGL